MSLQAHESVFDLARLRAHHRRIARLLFILGFLSLGACNLIFGIGDVDVDPKPCGDGDVVFPEVCDDGNVDDGDGCNSTCTSLTCQVPSTHASINDALNADCGTIQLAAGSYSESLVVRREVRIEGLADDVELLGGGGPLIVASMPLTLHRLAVTGGNSDFGGGIRATADLVLDEVVVSGNTASVVGAGVLVEGANLTASNVTVRDNILSGNNGAGISVQDGEFTISDSEITMNSATSAGIVFGSGLHLLNASGMLTNTQITGNSCSAATCRGVGASASNSTIELDDVSINANSASADDGSGIGLRIDRSNVVFRGGSVSGNTFSPNTAVDTLARGAGIHVIDSGFTLTGVVVADNALGGFGTNAVADGSGLNIFASNADTTQTVSILDCTFRNNTANVEPDMGNGQKRGSAGGGGLTATNSPNARLSIFIQRSAFIQNKTSGNFSSGAGMRFFGTANDASLVVTIINTTISGNTTSGGASAQGAGVLQGNSNIDFRHVTIVNNEFLGSPNQIGGGVFATSGTVTVENTIFDQNSDGTGASGDCGASTAANLVFDSATIVSDTTGCLLTGTPRVLDPRLDALADNGGPTQTHALQATSPALESGTSAGCVDIDGNALTVDQRGELRNGVCDVGAFEGPEPL